MYGLTRHEQALAWFLVLVVLAATVAGLVRAERARAALTVKVKVDAPAPSR